MKRALKILWVSFLATLLGSTAGILVALALYRVFPALYRETNNLPLSVDLGPAAGFDFLILAIVLLVIVSNVTASLAGIAVWSFLTRAKPDQK